MRSMKNIYLIGLVVLVLGVGAWMFWGTMSPVENPSGDTQWQGSNPPNSAEDAPLGSIHNLPVPLGVAAVRTLAAKEAGVGEGKVLILTVYDREWPDGCLGLAAAGEFCTQAIVPGYEVTVQVQGREIVYRSSADGSVVRKQL